MDRTLAHIPSSYGKLVYLASLRNPNSTGRYEHFGLAEHPNNADANRALRRSHESIFQEWVNYSLEQKKTDLELYICTIEQVERTELLDAWLRLTPYKNWFPQPFRDPNGRSMFRTSKPFWDSSGTCTASLSLIQPHSGPHHLSQYFDFLRVFKVPARQMRRSVRL